MLRLRHETVERCESCEALTPHSRPALRNVALVVGGGVIVGLAGAVALIVGLGSREFGFVLIGVVALLACASLVNLVRGALPSHACDRCSGKAWAESQRSSAEGPSVTFFNFLGAEIVWQQRPRSRR